MIFKNKEGFRACLSYSNRGVYDVVVIEPHKVVVQVTGTVVSFQKLIWKPDNLGYSKRSLHEH